MIRIELIGNYSARAQHLVIDKENASRGSPICDMARLLIARGRSPWELCQVWRNGTLCFADMPLARWAEKYVAEPDGGFHSARFRRWRAPPTPDVVVDEENPERSEARLARAKRKRLMPKKAVV